MENYELTRWCFQRALAFVYLMAFLAAARQFRPLCGEKGLYPISLFLRRVTFWDAPSLFFLRHDDRTLSIVAWVGVALSLFALTGVSEQYGLFLSMATWALLWVGYLSFANTGQLFYGYGWETLLLETGFLAIFMGSNDLRAAPILMWLVCWINFRVMFGAGLIKLRGDKCWWTLDCLRYHYETQPIPNPLSWYLHRLPVMVHKGAVLFTHFVELVVPFFYFAPPPISYIAGILTILFQITLILSGNLSWLNYITIVVTIPCFDDRFLRQFIPLQLPAGGALPWYYVGLLMAYTFFVIARSIQPVRNLFSSRQVMNTSFDPLHLVNTYGAFGSISRSRYEIIVEGTNDTPIDSDARWLEYEFPGKPGDIRRRPIVVAPYHLRLDWQMWFAAMGNCQQNPWFVHFVAKLLRGDPAILQLLSKNPFPETPPRYIRAQLYLYQFTSPADKTKNWWKREQVGEFFGPVSLEHSSLQNYLERYGWESRGLNLNKNRQENSHIA